MAAVTVDYIRYYPSGNGYIVGSDANLNGYEPTAAINKTVLSGTLVIPTTINGLPILGFAQFAFSRCYLLTKLIIQANIDVIAYRAFCDCYNLKNIEIPASLTTIESCGIHFYNFTAATNSQSYISDSSCTITFKKGFQLTTLKNEVFGYIKNLTLIFESEADSPIDVVDVSTFANVSHISVYTSFVQIGRFLFFGKYRVNDRTACNERWHVGSLSIGVFIFFEVIDS